MSFTLRDTQLQLRRGYGDRAHQDALGAVYRLSGRCFSPRRCTSANYWLGVVNLIGITLIAAIGLNILVGYCGQLSIGHAGFIAVGAYTSAILTNRLGVPFLVALICAGLVAGLVGHYLRHALGAGQGLLPGHHHHRRPVHYHLGHQPLEL